VPGPTTVSMYDALVRDARFAAEHRPDVVLRLGAPPTSRVASEWLDTAATQVVVDPDRAWLDPRHVIAQRVEADAELLLAALAEPFEDGEWLGGWCAADDVARRTADRLVDGWDEPFEGRVARDVVAAVPEGTALVVASSMPVRDVESFAVPRDGVVFHANRGV